jgi:hypothetical protein
VGVGVGAWARLSLRSCVFHCAGVSGGMMPGTGMSGGAANTPTPLGGSTCVVNARRMCRSLRLRLPLRWVQPLWYIFVVVHRNDFFVYVYMYVCAIVVMRFVPCCCCCCCCCCCMGVCVFEMNVVPLF